ncbi:hypothetical protein C0995_006502 [Termitomyces sp. Mi166|nr:hypothetical protein C0995_006502 [Termitomyces sp. Mi166\
MVRRVCSVTAQTPSRASSPRTPVKRALLIAINYENLPWKYRLNGPQQEVEELKKLLVEQYQYHPDRITVLTDKVGILDPNYPWKQNIVNALEHFYDEQQPGDEYIFYFAGHSFQRETEDKEEEDGMNEYILPSVDPSSETYQNLKQASHNNKPFREVACRDAELEKDDGIIDDIYRIIAVTEFTTGKVSSDEQHDVVESGTASITAPI